jgi:hypothetical protein
VTLETATIVVLLRTAPRKVALHIFQSLVLSCIHNGATANTRYIYHFHPLCVCTPTTVSISTDRPPARRTFPVPYHSTVFTGLDFLRLLRTTKNRTCCIVARPSSVPSRILFVSSPATIMVHVPPFGGCDSFMIMYVFSCRSFLGDLEENLPSPLYRWNKDCNPPLYTIGQGCVVPYTKAYS